MQQKPCHPDVPPGNTVGQVAQIGAARALGRGWKPSPDIQPALRAGINFKKEHAPAAPAVIAACPLLAENGTHRIKPTFL